MSVTFNRITRPKISDSVLNELLNRLLEGDLKVGDRLPSDADIADQLGAGRNSVREAMKVLQVLGVVERRQGDGSYVSSGGSKAFEILLFALMTRIQNPRDLMELRKVFEVGVVELLLPRISAEQIEKLEKIAKEHEALLSRRPVPMDDAVEKDVDFHLTIVECTGNEALLALANVILRLVRSSMREHLSDMPGREEAVRGHRATIEALKNRNSDEALKAINQSFDIWQSYITI